MLANIRFDFLRIGNCAGGTSVKKILLAALLAGAMCSPLAYGGGCSHVEAAEAVHAGVRRDAETDNLLLVNKTHKLPDDYEEKVDLVTVKNCFGKEFQVERETYKHFLSLREDLLKRGIQIELESAYRSVARQQEVIEELRATEGEDYVKKYAAVPGYSEHHTGLALDVAVVKEGRPIDDVYGTWETPYQKMHRRLAEHGFILRYLPESEGWYEAPHDTHYDLIQALTLYPAEPLAVLAESRDKKYCFVQLRNYVGWVDKTEIAFVDHDKWLKYAAPQDFLVFTAGEKRINLGDGSTLLFQMGARLPLKKAKVQRDGTWLAVVPVSVQGDVVEKLVSIPADKTVHKGWLPYSENNVLRQAFRFLGELYGWCGLEEGVDCSLFTADVYRSFGLDIPGDAVEQRTAMPMRKDIEKLGREGKLEAIGSCRPGDLLFTEGHVMLYLGKDDRGEPHIIHAASSRWFPGEGDEGALKYYTRRVTVDDLWWHKSDNGRCIDGLIAIGGLR